MLLCTLHIWIPEYRNTALSVYSYTGYWVSSLITPLGSAARLAEGFGGSGILHCTLSEIAYLYLSLFLSAPSSIFGFSFTRQYPSCPLLSPSSRLPRLVRRPRVSNNIRLILRTIVVVSPDPNSSCPPRLPLRSPPSPPILPVRLGPPAGMGPAVTLVFAGKAAVP